MIRISVLLGILLIFNKLCISANYSSSGPELARQKEISRETESFHSAAPFVIKTDNEFKKPLIKLFKKDEDKIKRRKKIISLILAFPLPFGILGLHRIYLGSKPYVPLVYIATLGGVFGIVPFIDFIVLLLEKDISKYINNPSIIMWAK